MTREELAKDGFVSVGVAETFTGLGKTTLYGMMANGELPYAKIGKSRRIPKIALVKLMAANIIVRDKFTGS